jgi:hypothetical protein
MKPWLAPLRLPLFVLGLLLIFYAERYLVGQSTWGYCLGVGLGGLVASIACSFWFVTQSAHESERASWRFVLPWQICVLISVGFYFGYKKVLGTSASPETPAAKVLLAAWLLTLILGVGWGLGGEWALRVSGRGRFAEPRRVKKSTMSWTLVSMLLVSLVGINYAASKKDKSWDWSYLKTAKPSESTVKILSSIENPLRIGLFFNSTNEVRGRIESYFSNVKSSGDKVEIQYYDAEVHPKAAEDFRASKNGQIILKYGEVSERMDLGTTLASARKTLKNFDAEFQKSLLAATAKRKTLYFTRGHGEYSWTGTDVDEMRSIRLLEGFLRSQNYTMRFFGVSEGSAKEVPQDADGVVIVGGDAPMLAEEASAISAYLDRGGGVLVMQDMDVPSSAVVSKEVRNTAQDPLSKVLADRGIVYHPTPLANASNFVAATKTEADSWFLFTNVFTSHDSTTALARNDQRAALLTFRSGYLAVTSEFNGWQSFETVRSLSDTFADENQDFKFTEGKERRNPYVIGAASIRKEDPENKSQKRGRMITLADASAASDVLIRNQGNLIYIVEALRWVSGDQSVVAGTGIASTEEDIKIQHTRKEDIAWFYGTVVAVPTLVLGLGFIATRRSRFRILRKVS